MTSHRIGVNLRVSGNCDQGARKYMEDNHVIKFLKKNTDDYEFAYFGIFDGHGGPDASAYCRDNLLNEITKYDGFWTNDDSQVLSAIRKGFLDTHHAMWNVLDSWPKTVTGLPSTSGSTATIAIIKQGKLYTGHVGDSALVLGENDAYGGPQNPVQAICITKEHKPDDPDERLRIENAGGDVVSKSGVPRVVWSRPKTTHKGPVRRSTHIDQIPFLAVARSLGDLWSYDYYSDTYVVSPDPDVAVLPMDPSKHRCLILASDGLWNMLTPEETVHMVMDLESQFEDKIVTDPNVAVSFWSNPAERLVARALNKWRSKALKADNTSCVVVLIDPLGPSKLTLLKRRRQELLSKGETPGGSMASQSKMAKLHTESEFRGDSRANKNANCSLSDSHIRVTDDSMIMPHSDRGMRLSAQQRLLGEGDGEECGAEDSINDSVQFFAKPAPPSMKWNLRHSGEDRRNMSLNVGSGTARSSQAASHKLASQSFSHPEPEAQRGSSQTFTKISDRLQRGMAPQPGPQLHDFHRHSLLDMEELEDLQEEGESDLVSDDQGEEIPNPPPCTPCTDEQSDSENTLHSSADVTDMAFSLASDESLGTPLRSLRASHRPTTPRSAPSKLSSSYPGKSHLSRSAKRKLARKQNIFTKPPAGQSVKQSASSSSRTVEGAEHQPSSSSQSTGTSKSSSASTTAFSVTSSVGMKSSWVSDNQAEAEEGGRKPVAVSTSTTSVGTSPPNLRSPVRRILNTSRSMNDVGTPPHGQKEPSKTRSSTGLTPAMGQLTTSSENPTLAAGTEKTLRPSNKASSADGEGVLNSSQASQPLKQLNKAGSGRRWGNFFRGSKVSLEQMFHVGKHGAASKKLNTTSSTGKLEGKSASVTTRNTSMSTSRLPDTTLDHSLRHLPDITLSHLADLNATTVTTGDMSALSADSATEGDYDDDSMLSLTDLAGVHHSMLEEGVAAGKVLKGQRRGFLQKTRVTLRRARKAAKKAFFPENHRVVKEKGSGLGKRRSDEFLPMQDSKRRRHLEEEKA